ARRRDRRRRGYGNVFWRGGAAALARGRVFFERAVDGLLEGLVAGRGVALLPSDHAAVAGDEHAVWRRRAGGGERHDARVLIEQDREAEVELADLGRHARGIGGFVDGNAEHEEAARFPRTVEGIEVRQCEQARLAEGRPEVDQDALFAEVVAEVLVPTRQRRE